MLYFSFHFLFTFYFPSFIIFVFFLFLFCPGYFSLIQCQSRCPPPPYQLYVCNLGKQTYFCVSFNSRNSRINTTIQGFFSFKDKFKDTLAGLELKDTFYTPDWHNVTLQLINILSILILQVNFRETLSQF